ncbi:alpha/beta fold hydrolase [Actinocrinis puniceicyclus]|uniref:Alpha/beta fold hydrolase n=1 Tax=Actinocrinis puniceicyclus TaxID=977794 RepID=A0A8J8BC73_9ACTN|nr:alpha/beta fold hydrolase [Actinocrinis puniceicyclus]MBS2964822.1 alpha/beta fold hydrolase [Actinocrinis puniceicyclus]
MWRLASDCLVPLEVGGTGRPLFCLHAVGGTVAYYAPVARRLGRLRDVYGLQCHGLRAGAQADPTIEEMAARYVAAITEVQSQGPYELIGYSMGGLIAAEMARILRGRGEAVSLVGMLDTEPPCFREMTLTFEQTLGLLSRAVGLRSVFAAEPGRTRGQLLHDFRERAIADGRVPKAFRIQDLQPLVEIYEVNGAAISRYKPAPVPVDVDYLCTGRPDCPPDVLVEGWRGYVEGELRVFPLDADHFALMHEQHAGEVCAVIEGWLNREAP